VWFSKSYPERWSEAAHSDRGQASVERGFSVNKDEETESWRRTLLLHTGFLRLCPPWSDEKEGGVWRTEITWRYLLEKKEKTFQEVSESLARDADEFAEEQ